MGSQGAFRQGGPQVLVLGPDAQLVVNSLASVTTPMIGAGRVTSGLRGVR
jgi:hypothetical protein